MKILKFVGFPPIHKTDQNLNSNSVKKRKAYKGAQLKMPVALPSKQLFIRPIDNETKYFIFKF